MERLIKMMHPLTSNFGLQTQLGQFDLIGPEGEVILPQVWESVVQPDCQVSMVMWPVLEKAVLADVMQPPGARIDESAKDEEVEATTRTETATTSTYPFTDSGYHSASREVTSQCVMDGEDGQVVQLAQNDVLDSATVYTVETQVPETEADFYVSEIADSLYAAVSTLIRDGEAIDNLAMRLPSLLQGFCLRLGHCSSSQIQREVMVFLHRNRKWVIYCYISASALDSVTYALCKRYCPTVP